jgi:hypothetical protein
VLEELVARARPDRLGRLRRRRATAGSRALRQVIERATDPVVTRRPSARNLADAVLAAVPLAQLPSAAGRTTAGAGGEAVVATEASSRPDTLDRIWGLGDQRSDDERWAAAFGGAPPDQPARATAATPAVPDLPVAVVRTPDWSAAVPDEPDPACEPDAASDDGRQPTRNPFAPGGAQGGAGLDGDDTGTWATARAHDPHRPGDGDRSGDGGAPGAGRDPGAWRSLDDADLTRDHYAPAARVAVGHDRRSAGDERPEGAPRARRLLLVAAGSALAGLGLTAGAIITGSGGGADTSRPEPEAAPEGRGCPTVAPPAADVDRDGCPEALVVEGTTVDAGIARWSLGEPGDLVALGDWDCDGDASAALLRPGTGDVFVFSAWAPEDEPVTVASTRRVDGGVGLRAEAAGDGCDHLVVDLAAGGTAPIEDAR